MDEVTSEVEAEVVRIGAEVVEGEEVVGVIDDHLVLIRRGVVGLKRVVAVVEGVAEEVVEEVASAVAVVVVVEADQEVAALVAIGVDEHSFT